MFEQAGLTAPEVAYETWDEFFAACDILKEKGITPLGMDTADLGWLSNLWYSGLIGTNGEAGNQFMNTMYPTEYGTPEVLEATTDLQKMLAQYTTADAVGGKYDTMATHFFNSEVAMIPNGPWMIPDIRSTEKAPEGFYDKVGIMLLPEYGMDASRIPNLFGNSRYAFWTVTATWILYSGFNTIIFLSEMGAVDPAIYEAARVDGAKPWQMDRYITIPLMKNILGTCVILASVAMVSQFDIIYMTTKGGPGNSTLNLPIYLYKAATLENNYGKANAVGVVQIVLGLTLVLVIQWLFREKKEKREAGV